MTTPTSTETLIHKYAPIISSIILLIIGSLAGNELGILLTFVGIIFFIFSMLMLMGVIKLPKS